MHQEIEDKKEGSSDYFQPTIASKFCLTSGTEQTKDPKIPVRPYVIAQNGRASGSFADNAAVPNPCALQHSISQVQRRRDAGCWVSSREKADAAKIDRDDEM
ncbi:hypothetical protein L1887_23137 [Cichorium endivia]|nr:hypothetical protein L1887_23137 [Cichorium endivia]